MKLVPEYSNQTQAALNKLDALSEKYQHVLNSLMNNYKDTKESDKQLLEVTCLLKSIDKEKQSLRDQAVPIDYKVVE